jgi:hypothetical protein
MLLLHGEGVVFEGLLKLLVIVALAALVLHRVWNWAGWGKRN